MKNRNLQRKFVSMLLRPPPEPGKLSPLIVIVGYADFATKLYHTSPEPVLMLPQAAIPALAVELNNVPNVFTQVVLLVNVKAPEQLSFAGAAVALVVRHILKLATPPTPEGSVVLPHEYKMIVGTAVQIFSIS
jgi:hypothetical protein